VLEAGRYRRTGFGQVNPRRRRWRAVVPRSQKMAPPLPPFGYARRPTLPFRTQRRSRCSALHRQEYLLCRRNRL
jgi:hypothetical protein